MQSLAERFHGRARITKVNMQRDDQVLAAFGASGYPTYIVFRDGTEVDRLTLGFLPWFIEARLERMIEQALHRDDRQSGTASPRERTARSSG